MQSHIDRLNEAQTFNRCVVVSKATNAMGQHIASRPVGYQVI